LVRIREESNDRPAKQMKVGFRRKGGRRGATVRGAVGERLRFVALPGVQTFVQVAAASPATFEARLLRFSLE
jgi:hypothetical protein